MAKKPPVNSAIVPAPAAGEPAALPEPVGGWPADEFTGIGGSYVRDPLTGKRRRAAPDVPAADGTNFSGET